MGMLEELMERVNALDETVLSVQEDLKSQLIINEQQHKRLLEMERNHPPCECGFPDCVHYSHGQKDGDVIDSHTADLMDRVAGLEKRSPPPPHKPVTEEEIIAAAVKKRTEKGGTVPRPGERRCPRCSSWVEPEYNRFTWECRYCGKTRMTDEEVTPLDSDGMKPKHCVITGAPINGGSG